MSGSMPITEKEKAPEESLAIKIQTENHSSTNQ
jgi:hypothetical protein